MFKEEAKKNFSTKEEGPMEEYVGCQVSQKDEKMWMHQPVLINKLEQHFGEDVKRKQEYDTPCRTPGFSSYTKD